jgi:fermentation-respiration switch protein FrsA (DUF1100 family)
VLHVLVFVAVFQVVAAGAAVCLKNRLLFFPSPGPPDAAVFPADVDARVVRVVRPDGRKLAAYDVAPRGLDDAAPVVLFFHGNAENIASRADLAAWFARTARVRLLLPDYSGYGGNEGSPSEDETYVDALAAYDHLAAQGVPASRIVVFGESIGGGPATYVAANRRVAGLALQSAFSSLPSMALRTFPWLPLAALFVHDSFPNVDRIAAVDAPVLVVHGTRDTIVPFAEGARLAAARPGAELLPVDGADHNDLYDVAGDAYLRGLGDRFRRWTSR